MLPSQVEILPPQSRPVQRLPWLALAAFAVAVAASFWLHPAISREQLFGDIAAKGLSIAAACALAAWLEHRIYAANSGYSGFRQVLVSALMPILSGGLGAALVYATLRLGARVHDDGTLLLAVTACALWLTNAALGSLVVVLVEVVLRRLAPGFRSRVTLAVFASFVLQIGLFALVYRFGWRVGGAVKGPIEYLRAHVAAHAILPDDIVAIAIQLTSVQKGIAAIIAFGTFVLLPTSLSACGKLADAATERVEPFVPACRAVGEGRLEVLLEEGGSREFAAASRAFNDMVEKLEETRRLERSFSPYLSQAVLRRIRAQYAEHGPTGSQRDATVLHVEIRGLLSFSQVIPTVRLFELLNLFFDRVAVVVESYEGYLDKFIGDAIIVNFNAPVDQNDHAERAARCSIDLQKETAAMNRAGTFAEIGQLSIAVGVATGPIISGTVGGTRGGQYAALGDTVSLASKLAGLAPPGQVWVNQGTAERLPADLPTLLLAAASVRGKAVPIVPHRVWPPP